MAEIFLARAFGAQGFEKNLVIKRILPHLLKDHNFVSMFVDEAKLTVNLTHANIIQIYELGDVNNQLYIAMEYIHGQDMFNIMDKGKRRKMPLPEDLAIHTLIEVLKGLDYAHQAKDMNGEPMHLVHRDISPTNIFVSYSGDVKLADFGIAKAKHARQHTQVGAIKGTLGYMSPEQVQGLDLDWRSDLFVCGVVLYEMVTGMRPFQGGSDLDILIKIRDGKFIPPSKVNKEISPKLEEIILKAMNNKVAKRYQTAADFAEDLADYLFGAGMRTSQRKLATYMKSLFADEIREDEEKARVVRQMIPSADSLQAAEAVQVFDAQVVQPPQSEVSITPTSTGTGVLTSSPKHPPAKEAQPPAAPPESAEFYIRDAQEGTTVGPVSITTIYQLAKLKKLRLTEEVSTDGTTWRSITHFPFPAKVVRAIRTVKEERFRTSHYLASQQPQGAAPEGRPTAVSEQQLAVQQEREKQRQIQESIERSTVKPRYSGFFTEVSPVKLFYRFAAAHETGRIELRRDKIIKQVYLREGLPEFVRSNVESEKLGEFLIRQGSITRDQFNIAMSNLAKHHGRLGDALLAMNALPAHELFQLLAQQVRAKILEIFSWKKGTYAFYPGEATTSEVIPLGIGSFAVLTEGVRAGVTKEDLLEYFRDKFDLPLKIKKNTVLDVEALKLSSKEMRVVKAIDGTKSINDLVFLVALSNEEMINTMYRTIYLLNEVELLSIG
ncbi:MAG: hypothetical protein Kow0090_02980 [Myxococcota bacterium]